MEKRNTVAYNESGDYTQKHNPFGALKKGTWNLELVYTMNYMTTLKRNPFSPK